MCIKLVSMGVGSKKVYIQPRCGVSGGCGCFFFYSRTQWGNFFARGLFNGLNIGMDGVVWG